MGLTFTMGLVFVPSTLQRLRINGFHIFQHGTSLFAMRMMAIFSLPNRVGIVLILLGVGDGNLVHKSGL